MVGQKPPLSLPHFVGAHKFEILMLPGGEGNHGASTQHLPLWVKDQATQGLYLKRRLKIYKA